MNFGGDNYIVSQREKVDRPASGSCIHFRHAGILSRPSSFPFVPPLPLPFSLLTLFRFESHTVIICTSQWLRIHNSEAVTEEAKSLHNPVALLLQQGG